MNSPAKLTFSAWLSSRTGRVVLFATLALVLLLFFTYRGSDKEYDVVVDLEGSISDAEFRAATVGELTMTESRERFGPPNSSEVYTTEISGLPQLGEDKTCDSYTQRGRDWRSMPFFRLCFDNGLGLLKEKTVSDMEGSQTWDIEGRQPYSPWGG